jgi:hypothetical protein
MTSVFAAFIVVHKEKNNENDKPQYCAAFATATIFASK